MLREVCQILRFRTQMNAHLARAFETSNENPVSFDCGVNINMALLLAECMTRPASTLGYLHKNSRTSKARSKGSLNSIHGQGTNLRLTLQSTLQHLGSFLYLQSTLLFGVSFLELARSPMFDSCDHVSCLTFTQILGF